MTRPRLIDEAGAKLQVAQWVAEGKGNTAIARLLKDEGLCDVSEVTVWRYVESMRSEKQFEEAMSVGEKKIRKDATALVARISQERLESFMEMVTVISKHITKVWDECEGNLARSFPIRDTEDPDMYAARMGALEEMFKNLPKMDQRLDAWAKISAEFGGMSMSRGGDTHITVNHNNIALQLQQITVDMLSWIPDEKRHMFMKRIKEIQIESS